eukprot:2217947-Pleurochrysis_carterae.AAC.2
MQLCLWLWLDIVISIFRLVFIFRYLGYYEEAGGSWQSPRAAAKFDGVCPDDAVGHAPMDARAPKVLLKS